METVTHRPHEVLPVPQQTTFYLGNEDKVLMANGLQPMGFESVTIDGEEHDVNVVAKLRIYGETAENNETVYLVQDGDEQTGAPIRACKIEEVDGKLTVADSKLFAGDEKEKGVAGTDNGILTLTQGSKQYRGWDSLGVKSRKGWGAEVTVAEASHPKREHAPTHSEAKRNARRQKIGAVVLALAALRGVTAPGGAQDRILDSRHDAAGFVGEHVETTTSLQEFLKGLSAEGEEIDGIHFTKAEAVETWKYNLEPDAEAGDRVARTMADLDKHNNDAIIKRYEAFCNDNPEGFLDDNRLIEHRQRLSMAKNTEEAVSALNTFMVEFNSQSTLSNLFDESQVNTDEFMDMVKYAGNNIIDTVGFLPKDLVRSAIGVQNGKDRGIELAFGLANEVADDGMSAYGVTAAQWNGSKIQFFNTGRIATGVANIPTADIAQTIVHELTHAIYDNDDHGMHEEQRWGSVGTRAKNILSKVAGRPSFTSDYATNELGEDVAETGADVLRGDIASPDHVNQFESRSNVRRLQMLANLEKRYPGIADYLVARLKLGISPPSK